MASAVLKDGGSLGILACGYPGIELASLTSPALTDGFFTTSATWEACEDKELEYYPPLTPPQGQAGAAATTASHSESTCPSLWASIQERPRSRPDSSHPHHPTYVWSRHPLGPSRGAPNSPSGKWSYKTPPHGASTRTSFRRIININHSLQTQHLPCKGQVHLSPHQPSQQVQVTTDRLLPGPSASALRGILRLCPASACQTGLPWSSPPA